MAAVPDARKSSGEPEPEPEAWATFDGRYVGEIVGPAASSPCTASSS